MRTQGGLRCDACDQAAPDIADPAMIPSDWRFVRIEGYAILLCAACLPPDGHALALTPDLCSRLGARGIHLGLCQKLWDSTPQGAAGGARKSANRRGRRSNVTSRNSLTPA